MRRQLGTLEHFTGIVKLFNSAGGADSIPYKASGPGRQSVFTEKS